MPDVDHVTDIEGPPPEGFSCPRCGSSRIRRSAPRSLGERVARTLSPVHFYRCRDCGRRGWHWGRVGRRRRRAAQPPGRPVEKRDLEALRTRRARTLFAVVAALGLGAASGLVVHSCEQRGQSFLPGRR